MSAKNAWGCVLIVLGVIAVISGFQQFAEVSQYDEIMRISKRQLGAYQSLIKEDLNLYSEVSRNAKIGGVMKIVFGIGFALWGTWLLQGERKRTRENYIPSNIDDAHDWKFKSDNEVEVEDFAPRHEPKKLLITPIYSDPSRPNISKARCESCKKVFTYPATRSGSKVSCPQCRVNYELP